MIRSLLLLSLIFFLVLAGPVYAIGNPSYVSVGDVFVFRNVLETGDQLYFVRYDVSYSPVPTEDPEDTWEVALYTSAGALYATRPLNYYQHNIISIYLTPSQALTWQVAHQLIVRGSPAVFGNLTENLNQKTRTLGAGDYREASDLGSIMLSQAQILQDDWGITLLVSGRLNTTGSTYFIKAVPGLSNMDSTIFQYSSSIYQQLAFPTPDPSYANQLHAHLGGLNSTLVSLASIWAPNMSTGMMGVVLTLLGLLVVGGVTFSASQKPEVTVGMMGLSLLGATWLGLFPFAWFIAIFVFVAFLIILVVSGRV